jgi:hypothetical protein
VPEVVLSSLLRELCLAREDKVHLIMFADDTDRI